MKVPLLQSCQTKIVLCFKIFKGKKAQICLLRCCYTENFKSNNGSEETKKEMSDKECRRRDSTGESLGSNLRDLGFEEK